MRWSLKLGHASCLRARRMDVGMNVIVDEQTIRILVMNSGSSSLDNGGRMTSGARAALRTIRHGAC
jgi:hypothetical protein